MNESADSDITDDGWTPRPMVDGAVRRRAHVLIRAQRGTTADLVPNFRRGRSPGSGAHLPGWRQAVSRVHATRDAAGRSVSGADRGGLWLPDGSRVVI